MLDDLRAKGQGDRADRLLELQRQLDEGRFDPDALMEGLAERIKAEYGQCPQECEQRGPRPAKSLRTGGGKP